MLGRSKAIEPPDFSGTIPHQRSPTSCDIEIFKASSRTVFVLADSELFVFFGGSPVTSLIDETIS
jgi:hypothetical protein